MKLVAILATLAAASSAVAQHGAGDGNDDCGLGLELCNRVKAEYLSCCEYSRPDLITALTAGSYMIQETDPERGERMRRLAEDIQNRF